MRPHGFHWSPCPTGADPRTVIAIVAVLAVLGAIFEMLRAAGPAAAGAWAALTGFVATVVTSAVVVAAAAGGFALVVFVAAALTVSRKPPLLVRESPRHMTRRSVPWAAPGELPTIEVIAIERTGTAPDPLSLPVRERVGVGT